MLISRRTFLSFLAQSSVVALLPQVITACSKSPFVDQANNIILGGGRYADPANVKKVNYVLSVVNLSLKDKQLVPLGFLAHGVIVDPNDYFRLIMFEKIGPGACEVDLNAMRVTRKISTSSNKYFYGHGAFSSNGKTLYCTETYLDNKKGIIAIRDAKTMQILGEFPTYGDNPHECQLIDNGNVMVVTNAGSVIGGNTEPSVTYIDMNNQQLIERVLLTNSRINTGHMGIARDGSLVVVSAPRDGLAKTEPGGVSIRPHGESMETIMAPNEVVNAMTGEALSVIIHDAKNIAAVTHPDGNMVTFWSVSNRRLLQVINVEKPRGVTLTMDEKTFVVSYGLNTSIMQVDVDTLSEKGTIIPVTYLSGSHIYNWSKTLTEILPLGDFA